MAGGWATAVGVLEEGVTGTLVSNGRVLEGKGVTFARRRCTELLWHSCFVLYALHAGSRYGGGVFFGGETGGVNVDDVVRQGTLARGIWCGRLAHVLKYRISIPHTRETAHYALRARRKDEERYRHGEGHPVHAAAGTHLQRGAEGRQGAIRRLHAVSRSG